MVDTEKVLKNIVKKGKVKIGFKETRTAISNGSAQMVIISNNSPHSKNINELAKKKNIPVYNYKSSSIDLGYTCGKAFAVSVFAVLDDAGSNIIHIAQKDS